MSKRGKTTNKVTIIGAGLAGTEAAHQLAARGIPVELWEMRPQKTTSAHNTGLFAELVCSNSFRGSALENAVGLLKEEMRRLGSLFMQVADEVAVPAGGALAVDRDQFAAKIDSVIRANPLITVCSGEVEQIPAEGLVIVAAGPLVSDALATDIGKQIGAQRLFFYDAIAPIVSRDSIDFDQAFMASRYDKGDGEYINCPLNEEQYNAFYQELIAADLYPAHDADTSLPKFFEGCMPVEELATRGPRTLLFGPMKPVGLTDPKTGRWPHAVVQLRMENRAGTTYNMVGFQTRLRQGEQRRVLSMIPALAKADFVRWGSMHRNTFINSPELLEKTLNLRADKRVYIAGQLSGVEGYVESAASGLLVALYLHAGLAGAVPLCPETTALGAISRYIVEYEGKNFQPSNVNFGLFPALPERIRGKRNRAAAHAQRALADLGPWVETIGVPSQCILK